jgi:hypothetical protein
VALLHDLAPRSCRSSPGYDLAATRSAPAVHVVCASCGDAFQLCQDQQDDQGGREQCENDPHEIENDAHGGGRIISRHSRQIQLVARCGGGSPTIQLSSCAPGRRSEVREIAKGGRGFKNYQSPGLWHEEHGEVPWPH